MRVLNAKYVKKMQVKDALSAKMYGIVLENVR